MSHEATKLVLGRGEVYFDHFASGTVVGDGERYLGNTPSFQLTREIKRQERSTSYFGMKQGLKGAVISEEITVQLTIDHMSQENVDLWFSSLTDNTVFGDELINYEENIRIKKGRFFQLGSAIYPGGLKFVHRVMLTVGGVALIGGRDYNFEQTTGRIEILPGAQVNDGDIAFVSYLKRPYPVSLFETQTKPVMGALRYISRNPYGPRLDYWFPQVQISPRGALEMKSDEFRQLNFDIQAKRLGPQFALLYGSQNENPPREITADTTLITADSTKFTADLTHYST